MRSIREYRVGDEDAVVDLSIQAWTPVFECMAAVLGSDLDARLHGREWRVFQAAAVRSTLANPEMKIWVADLDDHPIGFVAAIIRDLDRGLGEIEMLAVDPQHQGSGLGEALTNYATAWLRDVGMRVAMIGTGGDPGHAPARRTYEKAGYLPMPLVRYFKAL